VTYTVPCFIPQSAISLKNPQISQIPKFSPNVAEIPNLGTNSPKVATLLDAHGMRLRRMRLISWRHVLFWCVWYGLRSSTSES